jgi:tetratricopeptide repeat protein
MTVSVSREVRVRRARGVANGKPPSTARPAHEVRGAHTCACNVAGLRPGAGCARLRSTRCRARSFLTSKVVLRRSILADVNPIYRCRLGTALLSLALLAPTSNVFARAPAPKAEASPTDEAGALVERGIALRRAGNDAEALKLFQQAEQLDPDSTRIQVHLAATHQALGEWEAADGYLSRALAHPDDPYVQRHEATLAAARHTIDGHIGLLELTGGPRGAEVRLNGRLVGTLPIDQTLRVKAGIYTMEARLPGHYPVTRSVALAGGVLVRESIELAPLSPRARAFRPEDQASDASTGRNWLGWTFTGLAVGAGVVTGAAWLTREQHADRWNDDEQCLRPGLTREQACGNERSAGERANTWMLIGATTTGAFAAAALVSYWVNRQDEEAPGTALNCGVGLGQVQCAGRF